MTTNTRRWQALNERLKDNEQVIAVTYTLPGVDFGTANGPFEIVGPAGKIGKLVDIMALATEVFATDATEGTVIVGTAADPNGYAISDGITDALAVGDSENLTFTEGALGSIIDPDTTIIVTPTAGVDAGAESGIATVMITILWV